MIHHNQDDFFNELYDTTHKKILAYIIVKCGNTEDVADIFQETYTEIVKVIRKHGIEYFKKPEAFVMQVAKKKIYLYYPSPEDDISEGGINECCFFAEKNGKKLCMFSIYIEWDTGKVSFQYDKMADSHFICDEETVGETLFYEIDETFYAETPDKVSTVWARKSIWGEGQKMMGDDENEIDWEAEWAEAYRTFKEKSYNEKKDEIFADLTGTKKGIAYKKAEKKVEKNLKRELKDKYVEPETDKGESDRTSINIVVAISIIVLEVIAVGIIYMKKREKE